MTGFPGLSVLSGARVLAEIGDDRGRFADARAVKALAGAAPVTRAWPQPRRRRPNGQESASGRRRIHVGPRRPSH
ncbi:transposase [Streptomyces fildesensis]|uniref:transposase n=1 Tax=Streptomyces fildesensis TaxID=375757 RepID=UPI0027DD4A58|nr:transposase [Streptomyces fildesensis]